MASGQFSQRDAQGIGHGPVVDFTGVAYVKYGDVASGAFLVEGFDVNTRALLNDAAEFGERAGRSLQVAGDPVETDPAQPHGGLFFTSRVGDDHDLVIGADDHPGGFGKTAIKTDVQGPGEVAFGEVLR